MFKIETATNNGIATARYHDSIGPVGPECSGKDAVEAAFTLGVMFGAHPEKFARTLGEILQ